MRYVPKFSAERYEQDDPWNYPMDTNLSVIEQEWESHLDTGLVNKDGVPLYRVNVKNKLGFI